MKFLPLLGKKLKDDEMIEILEGFEMDVFCDSRRDRFHELLFGNIPDTYWATSKPKGFQFSFDDSQRLVVVFLYVTPRYGFAAVSQHDCDVPFFDSKQDVEAFGEAQHLQVTKGSEVSADEVGIEWVRLGFASHSIRYTFRAGSLDLVIILRIDEPAA